MANSPSSITAEPAPMAENESKPAVNGVKPTVANGSAEKSPGQLDASLLTTTITNSPRPLPEPTSLEVRVLGYYTDHMITASWNDGTGWSAPSLQPFGPISVLPTISGLHYATECFEGLKFYRDAFGQLRLFRPRQNCERMRRSAAKVALPEFDPAEMEKLIVALCAREAPKWLPASEGEGVLYVRPAMFGTDGALATHRPRSAMLTIVLAVFPKITRSIASGAGKEAPDKKAVQRKPFLTLLGSTEKNVRAWPGGFGDSKIGANYGPTLVTQDEAKAQGYDQILWLLGKEGVITEAGASNFFVVLRSPDDQSKLQLITAPVEQGVILPGITRDSVLQLARERLAGIEVVERRLTMDELEEAHEKGTICEAFVTGTAFFVAPVGLIRYRDQDLSVPWEAKDGEVLPSAELKKWLMDIMYGREDHDWALTVKEIES